MAKITHNNFLDTVNEVFTDAKQQGIMHLYAEGEDFSGRTIGVGGQNLFHFGTTGYLGLEQDQRLKEAAIEAIRKYGTQFPLSKSYISNPLYAELEAKLTEMYQNPIIITKNSTLGHMGVIPNAVSDQDAIILDHQVHWSVQSAAKVLKNRSVPIDMIRHNNLNMLEDKIKRLSDKHKRIWYMADGIYSMYGDFAPLKDLKALCLKYPQLHLYIDDVHGMSWTGKNGTGYALGELGELSEHMLVFGTLSKTFGASGAVLACSNEKMYHEIKTFGGPLTFSAQLEPASVAAAIASADIHLSEEIYELQNDLNERVMYFNILLQNTNLPLIDQNHSPVFFIGTVMPKTGYNFVSRLMKEGFFVNLGIFPAVPVKNTGVRLTISRHNEKPEIESLEEAMVYHFPKALEDTHTNLERVCKAFKMEPKTEKQDKIKVPTELQVKIYSRIEQLDKQLWNTTVGKRGVYDWEGLQFLESVFSGNRKPEHNWTFKYIQICDAKGQPILLTFLTLGLWKDDMLAKESASKQIENQRETMPYHLTSRVLSMGSLFTEGEHWYLNEQHHLKQEALGQLIKTTETLEQELQAKMVVLRDFDADTPWHDYFQGQGFVRVKMPNACHVDLKEGITMETFVQQLSSRNRRHIRKEILAHEDNLHIEVLQQADTSQLHQIAQLYHNVHKNNLGLNTFTFPQKLFASMSEHPNWEFITIRLRENPLKIIGVMLCYNNNNTVYVPAFVGLDYNYVLEYHVYRQLLYQTINRAIALQIPKIDFGMTAAFEKRKLGAVVEEKFAYLQTADNYTLELIGILE
ncbi:GNAT family N-acetyltransferase [Tamlana fucoidanivorans]|uniref:Aminotransferase class I/II-fold pyridoxal phosphate-dependent enzyme n=1 Tax=Allotamlana fucoidanivorans TaxID=2583814 RepID=A0A5C4SQ71_9FLAO|nr:bifunctional aminotransferase class I/II-fold pyridoxal phosphate-dependent enzyme/GNAT family N-acetyltransferase [Tamlana fucoidanivorans]TNJ46076.1 aminotransferase class I/II-fold pyridoxal phosphate-dependent enzyme [Tamlana fucoidanivorans]